MVDFSTMSDAEGKQNWSTGMTIATCYVSPEGVVLGADSTSTAQVGQTQFRHFDFAQKIFEFGEHPSTVGVVIWGLGSPGAGVKELAHVDSRDSRRNMELQTFIHGRCRQTCI